MLIFDQFPDRSKAEAFAQKVRDDYQRTAHVCDSQEESNVIDIFPFELFPPIVLVSRNDDCSGETVIEILATHFGGSFAGT